MARIESCNIGTIAMFNDATDDDLGKVEAWNRTRPKIDPDDRGGVSSVDGRLL